MKRSPMYVVSFGVVLAAVCGPWLWAGEKDDAALAKAPAKVQAAARKALGDKKLDEFDKESVGDTIIYEVGYKVDGVDHAYIIDEAGEVIREGADVELSKLPAAVTAAVKNAHPDGKLDEAAAATAGGKHFYVVEIKVGQETRAIQVSEDGKILADEVTKSLGDNAK